MAKICDSLKCIVPIVSTLDYAGNAVEFAESGDWTSADWKVMAAQDRARESENKCSIGIASVGSDLERMREAIKEKDLTRLKDLHRHLPVKFSWDIHRGCGV